MYGLLEGKRQKLILEKLKNSWELKSNYYIDFETAFLSMICYLGTKVLAQFNSGFFEFSKVTIMMKVLYFIIFRSAISTPILAAALFSTLGTVFISMGLHFVFSRISDYKKIREVELAFQDFKVITSNLSWDNEQLQRLLMDATYYRDVQSQGNHTHGVHNTDVDVSELLIILYRTPQMRLTANHSITRLSKQLKVNSTRCWREARNTEMARSSNNLIRRTRS